MLLQQTNNARQLWGSLGQRNLKQHVSPRDESALHAASRAKGRMVIDGWKLQVDFIPAGAALQFGGPSGHRKPRRRISAHQTDPAFGAATSSSNTAVSISRRFDSSKRTLLTGTWPRERRARRRSVVQSLGSSSSRKSGRV